MQLTPHPNTWHLLGALAYLACLFAVLKFTPKSRSRHPEPEAKSPYCLGKDDKAPVNTGAIWPSAAWETIKEKGKRP